MKMTKNNFAVRSSVEKGLGKKPGAKKSAGKEQAGAELLQALQTAIEPGRGNSHWLSFKEVGQLLSAAKSAAPADRAALKSTLSKGLETGKIGEQPLFLGAKANKLLAAFCEMDPQIYLQVAPAATQLYGKAKTGFDKSRNTALAGAQRSTPSAAMAQTVSRGLSDVAEAVKTPRAAKDLSNLESVREFANDRLDLHLADRGLKKEGLDVEIRFDRSQWKPNNFKNQRGLEDAIEGAAAFLAQMAEDRGGEVSLAVALTPKGDLNKTAGAERDTLWVPINKGVDGQALRKDWDDGAFIKADNWWNPMDHMKAGKLRGMWKLVGNPVGVVRTRLRRVFGDVQTDLGKSLQGLLSKAGSVPLDELREKATEVVRTFVGPDVQTRDGANLRDTMVEKFATVDEDVLVNFLGRWDAAAQDNGLLEEVNNFSLSATANHLKDSQIKIGLVKTSILTMPSASLQAQLSHAMERWR